MHPDDHGSSCLIHLHKLKTTMSALARAANHPVNPGEQLEHYCAADDEDARLRIIAEMRAEYDKDRLEDPNQTSARAFDPDFALDLYADRVRDMRSFFELFYECMLDGSRSMLAWELTMDLRSYIRWTDADDNLSNKYWDEYNQQDFYTALEGLREIAAHSKTVKCWKKLRKMMIDLTQGKTGCEWFGLGREDWDENARGGMWA